MKTLAQPEVLAEVRRRLAAVTPESERQWGTMTPDEMLCHLADAFAIPLEGRAVRRVDNAFTRTVMKWVALWAPLKWPHGVRTLPEINPRKAGTRPAEFAADRDRVMAMTERFAALDRAAELPPNALFGPLSHRAWMRWGYLHLDHHLRQFGV